MIRALDKGIELLDEIEGVDDPAVKGSQVKYCARMYLKKGGEVTSDPQLISKYPEHLTIKTIDGTELVEGTLVFGTRQAIAGIEKALFGMRKNEYRDILVSRYLAYRSEGIPGKIPKNALLRIELWVRDVQCTRLINALA